MKNGNHRQHFNNEWIPLDWALCCWASITPTIQVSGYGWPNALRNAWLIAEGQTLHYDYFRDPLYSVLLNAVVGFTDTYAQAAWF